MNNNATIPGCPAVKAIREMDGSQEMIGGHIELVPGTLALRHILKAAKQEEQYVSMNLQGQIISFYRNSRKAITKPINTAIQSLLNFIGG